MRFFMPRKRVEIQHAQIYVSSSLRWAVVSRTLSKPENWNFAFRTLLDGLGSLGRSKWKLAAMSFGFICNDFGMTTRNAQLLFSIQKGPWTKNRRRSACFFFLDYCFRLLSLYFSLMYLFALSIINYVKTVKSTHVKQFRDERGHMHELKHIV